VGDIILIKTYVISLLLLTLNLNSTELQWVDEQIDAIKPLRVGLKLSDVSVLRDPIIFIEQKKEETVGKSNFKTKSKKIVKRKKTYRSYSKTSSKSKINYKTIQNFKLEAIINNSALISGKWYKLNDKIKTFKISEIDRTTVLLMKKGKNIILSTSNRNRTIKFKNR